MKVPVTIKNALLLFTASIGLAACQSSTTQTPIGPVAGAQCGAFGGGITTPANAIEPNSGREFYLEYPCDLQADEQIVLVLNLHGAGSSGSWQRLYFPLTDYADDYRLVVAAPTAATASPMRVWRGDADDQYLQDITELLLASFGQDNIKSFWLAGHSQGGMTSTRIICSDYFADRVDGFLSLAGGRTGTRGSVPDCDFSHIFTTGELDSAGVAGVPSTSPVADRYNCDARVQRANVVDTEAGKVWDSRTTGRPTRAGWGGEPGPGTAEVYVFPGCDDGRVVADIIRLDKGHTEGLEPRVTETIVELMASIPGGKLRNL